MYGLTCIDHFCIVIGYHESDKETQNSLHTLYFQCISFVRQEPHSRPEPVVAVDFVLSSASVPWLVGEIHGVGFLGHAFHPPVYQLLVLSRDFGSFLLGDVDLDIQGQVVVLHLLVVAAASISLPSIRARPHCDVYSPSVTWSCRPVPRSGP